MAHSNNASITRISLPTINSTPLLNDSVHCSTRNTIEKLYNSNQNLASHLLCQAHSEMFKKLRNSHLNLGDRQQKQKQVHWFGMWHKINKPLQSLLVSQQFFFCLLYDDDERNQIFIALLLADICKSYMKVSLLISSCKLLTLTVLRIFH